MMKRLFQLMLAVLMTASAQASSVTPSQALDIAQAFVSNGSAKFKATADNSLILAHQALSVTGKPDYYVFNRGSDGGFIVVSGEDKVLPVCGYSESGSFDFDKMPCNVRWWFSDYQRQMQYLRDHPQVTVRKNLNLSTSVAPMLTTKWNQCKPYNDLCPVAPSENDPYWVYGNRACTGCVATATAQIMNYFQWPKQGKGSKSYTFDLTYYNASSGGAASQTMTLSADFSQSTYQWNLMKDEYLYMDKNNYGYFDENWHVYIKIIDENGDTITDPNGIHSNAVAKLMSDVGIAVEMMYGSYGSGAYSANVYYALWDHFSYVPGYAYRDNFDGDWDETLRSEIDLGHPLYCSGGNSNASGGHAFVFDGYDNQGRFHVNWGWGGHYDGYFVSSALLPADGHDYSYYQEVVAGEPYIPISTSPADGETIDFGLTWIGGSASEVAQQVMVYGMYLEQDVSVTVVGADAAMFDVVSSLPADLVNSSDGYALNVFYRPTSRGQHHASLVIDPGDGLTPVTLPLTGQAQLYYDVNKDGVINVSDVTSLIDLCLNNGYLDYKGDKASITDVTILIDYLLSH